MVEMKPKSASAPSPKKPISAAAQRGLAEAAARRAEGNRAAAEPPPELGSSGKLDPVRYGDWEIRGIATDF
jgi:hypothetical protein